MQARRTAVVFGIYGHPTAAGLTYFAVRAPASRPGKAPVSPRPTRSRFAHPQRGMGLVGQVFDKPTLRQLVDISPSATFATQLLAAPTFGKRANRALSMRRGQICHRPKTATDQTPPASAPNSKRKGPFPNTVASEIIIHLLASSDGDQFNPLEKRHARIQGASPVIMGGRRN